MVVHVARPSYLRSNFHQPLTISLIYQPHPKSSSRPFSHRFQSRPQYFFCGSSILPIKVARRWEGQSSISSNRDPVTHLHLNMSEFAKSSESNPTPTDLSEFLSAQRSAYLQAVGEGKHMDVWTISMGNEAGG